MHAMDFYVSTCRCVMQADPRVPDSWADLHRLLPCLRQSLSCYVCFQLLLEPMGPDHNVCKHSVCEKCVGGKMKLKPSCSWCKDHWDFVPNTLLKVLVSCFKKLCVYIYNSQIGRSICNSSVNGETNNLMLILKEVVDFDDNYSPGSQSLSRSCVNPNEQNSKHSGVQCETESLEQPEISVDAKPGCSSDDDASAFPVLSCEEQTEEIKSFDIKEEEPVVQRRRHLSRNSSRTRTSEIIASKKVVRKQTLLNQKIHKRAAVKSILMKKAPQHNRKTFLRKKIVKQISKKQPKSRFHELRRQNSKDAPQHLEKMDNSEPLIKKVKKELQPPELKPPSFCKCGKSGNFNQLTCLGQRCPCYSMKLPCIGCKCKGCRNPKKGPNIQSNKINYMSDLWSSCSRTSSAVS